jgi:hypothetical protein
VSKHEAGRHARRGLKDAGEINSAISFSGEGMVRKVEKQGRALRAREK